MSILSKDSNDPGFKDYCEYPVYETEYYCNYPELAKSSKPNMEVTSRLSHSFISDSDFTSETTSCTSSDSSSASFHNLEERLKTPSSEKLSSFKTENESFLSELSESKIQEESGSESCEEEETLGWLKYSTIASPWDESKDPLLLKSEFIPTETDGVLTKEMISSGSSNIDQLPDTKAFVLTRLQLSDKGLRDISELWSYQYFQYIDLSWNEICDLSAISTLYLMCLDVSHNKLTTVLQFKPPWFLTHVNLSCNEIKEISDLSDFWSLRHLNFSYNMIKKIEGLQNLKFLRYLNLSHNHIECVDGLSNLCLQELHLEYNLINRFEEDMEPGLKSLPNLETLVLSNNCISNLCYFKEVHTLKLLELNENCITELLQLENLSSLKNLRQLNLIGNDVTNWPAYREFVIYSVSCLLCLDFMMIEERERVAAQTLLSPDILSAGYYSHAKLNTLNQLSKQVILSHVLPVDEPPFPIVVFVGPSACYKRTLASKLAANLSDHVHHCLLYTTQPIPPNIDMEYKAITLDKFNEMTVAGEFLAVTELLGFKYGFCRDELCKCILENKLCLLCLPLEAAFSLKVMNLRPHFVLTILNDTALYSEKLKMKFQTLRPVIHLSEKLLDFESYNSLDTTTQESISYYSGVSFGEEISTTTQRSGSFTQEEEDKSQEEQDKSQEEEEKSQEEEDKTQEEEDKSQKEQDKSQEEEEKSQEEEEKSQDDEDKSQQEEDKTQEEEDKSQEEQDKSQAQEVQSFSSPTSSYEEIKIPTCGMTGYVHDDSAWSFSLMETESEPPPEPVLDEAMLAAERSQKLFVKQVMRMSQVYINLHNNSPGLFVDVVYTDNLKQAFNKLKDIIHNIYNDRINWKPRFKAENDPLYEEMVRPRIDFLMLDLLGAKSN